jgi:hypothetical protein
VAAQRKEVGEIDARSGIGDGAAVNGSCRRGRKPGEGGKHDETSTGHRSKKGHGDCNRGGIFKNHLIVNSLLADIYLTVVWSQESSK